MNTSLNIEKLIAYAKIHLLLDEADEIYVRNALVQELKVTGHEIYEVNEDELETLGSPYSIIDPLLSYAVEKGICAENEKPLLAAKLMDIVSLRPGEIEDTFESLEKNPAKAFEWAFDYAQKNGSTRTDFTKWDNKGVNLEVVFDEAESGDKCTLCVENEGLGEHRNERYIMLNALGDWYYKAARHAYFKGMAHIVSSEHGAGAIDESTLNTMFDFIEFAPTMFILTGDDMLSKHAHFVCGNSLLPIHKAGDKLKHKNKEYPYINITETDWLTSAVKLGCTNRGKLIEFTMKLVGSFKKEFGDGKMLVSVRKVESKFIVDLAFTVGEPKREHSMLAKVDTLALAGLFRIGGFVDAKLKEIEKYLTKEVRFTPMCLKDGMEAFAEMIDTLLKEAGGNKLGAVEAALDVKEECKKNLAAQLSDIAAYSDIKNFTENL